MNDDDSRRSSQKKAALVYLLRNSSLKNRTVAKWAKLLFDKLGAQIRTQALIEDLEFAQAELFLNQYISLFGNDPFTRHTQAFLAWKKGQFNVAYNTWLTSKDVKDFRLRYVALGWHALVEEIYLGKVSPQTLKQNFKYLLPVAKKSSEKYLLAWLCANDKAICEGKYSTLNLGTVLSQKPEKTYSVEFPDKKGAIFTRVEALGAYFKKVIAKAEDYASLEKVKVGLSALYSSSKMSERGSKIRRDHKKFKAQYEERLSVLENRDRQRLLAKENKQ